MNGTPAESLCTRDGDAFVGVSASGGPWRNGGQSGGAVLALLSHVIEEVHNLTTIILTRLTVGSSAPRQPRRSPNPWHRTSGERTQVKIDTPPGPTSSPTMISTAP